MYIVLTSQAICNLINTNQNIKVLSMFTVYYVHVQAFDCKRILLLNYKMEQLQQLSFLKLVEAFLNVLILRRDGWNQISYKIKSSSSKIYRTVSTERKYTLAAKPSTQNPAALEEK